jgi:hypothetical protein
MVHLTYAQREALKKVVLTATIQRLTIAETQQYVKEKVGLDMSLDYIWRVKSNLKKASQNQLAIYQKDKFAYIEEIFFKRVAELENNQDILRNIIANNEDRPEAQIKAVAELSQITILLRKIFEMLPSTTRLGVDAFPIELTGASPLESLQQQLSSASTISSPASPSPPLPRRYPGISIADMELSEEELAEVNEEANEVSTRKRSELKTNKFIREVMPYYKAEVMRVHKIADEQEYNRRVIDGDQSIYLPQPNPKFAPTLWFERAAHALGLDYQGMQDKISRGEVKHKIATGTLDPEADSYGWYDEDPNAVF